MGARGPKPKPSALKKAQGTYRADRAPQHEAVATGKPSCPAWLSKDAKKEFRRVVKLLEAANLVGKLDGNALTRYAQTWERWRKAEAMLAKSGEVIPFKNDDGSLKYLQQSPYVAIARQLADQLHRLEQSLGMNPSSRSRIDIESPKEADAFDAFLNSPPNPPLKLVG